MLVSLFLCIFAGRVGADVRNPAHYIRLELHRILNDTVADATNAVAPRVLVRNAGGQYKLKQDRGEETYSRGTAVLIIGNETGDSVIVPEMMDTGWRVYDEAGVNLPKTLTSVSSKGVERRLRINSQQRVGLVLGLSESAYAAGRVIGSVQFSCGGAMSYSENTDNQQFNHVDSFDGTQKISIDLIRIISDTYEIGSRSVAIRPNQPDDGVDGFYDYDGFVLLLENLTPTDVVVKNFGDKAWKMRFTYNDGDEVWKDGELSMFISKDFTSPDGKITVKRYATMAFVIGLGDDQLSCGPHKLKCIQIQYDDGAYRFNGSLDYDKELRTLIMHRNIISPKTAQIEVDI